MYIDKVPYAKVPMYYILFMKEASITSPSFAYHEPLMVGVLQRTKACGHVTTPPHACSGESGLSIKHQDHS